MSLRRHRRANTPSIFVMVLLSSAAYAAGQEGPPRRQKAEPPPRRPARDTVAAAPRNAPDAPAKGEAQPGGNRIRKFAPQSRKPSAPWVLDEQQQATLDRVLAAWEKKSTSIKTLTCTFTMWEYDFIFDNNRQPEGQQARPTRVNRGEIKYARPDRGVYHITHQATGQHIKPLKFERREGDYWVCDGQAVYEFNHEQKRLIERRLPEQLKGSAISNGPLPFLFGASADQMRGRYWLRVSTPPEDMGKKIWLDAVPRFVEDRANYQTASIILSEKDMLPAALQLVLPEGNRKNYKFEDYTINSLWKKIIRDFDLPPLPDGWDHIVEEAPRAEAARPAPPPGLQTLRVEPPPRSRQRK
ncbi:MAG TPA: TIGR03009 domain-containing protein [Pirellulales bacterium]|nr:TIGR03009 domain-containing protein [Pirellulales bacterium]